LERQPALLCTVRDCHAPLGRADRRLVCLRGHSFDLARSGYINLLQPQDRRSKAPGDSPGAVAARRRLHDRGFSAPLLDAISRVLAASPEDAVLDAGSGDGFYLGSLARQHGFRGCGIDISIPAVDAAARRYRECEWAVANADRFIPYAEHCFSVVMSITARMNPAEFHRVLRADGRLLVALPAPDDLIELRGVGRERIKRTTAAFAPKFKLVRRERTTTTAELDTAAVEDILMAIYRPLQTKPTEPAQVTFSLDLLLFEPV
jgi:23S rRNA (guanine745-N1)-methyltransferase